MLYILNFFRFFILVVVVVPDLLSGSMVTLMPVGLLPVLRIVCFVVVFFWVLAVVPMPILLIGVCLVLVLFAVAPVRLHVCLGKVVC